MRNPSAMDLVEELLKKNKGKWLSPKFIASYQGMNYARTCKACDGLTKRNIAEKRFGPRTDDLSLLAYRWVDS